MSKFRVMGRGKDGHIFEVEGGLSRDEAWQLQKQKNRRAITAQYWFEEDHSVNEWVLERLFARMAVVESRLDDLEDEGGSWSYTYDSRSHRFKIYSKDGELAYAGFGNIYQDVISAINFLVGELNK